MGLEPNVLPIELCTHIFSLFSRVRHFDFPMGQGLMPLAPQISEKKSFLKIFCGEPFCWTRHSNGFALTFLFLFTYLLQHSFRIITIRQNAQNFGIRSSENLCKLPIDKMCERWYNGKFGAGGSSARRQNKESRLKACSLID